MRGSGYRTALAAPVRLAAFGVISTAAAAALASPALPGPETGAELGLPLVRTRLAVSRQLRSGWREGAMSHSPVHCPRQPIELPRQVVQPRLDGPRRHPFRCPTGLSGFPAIVPRRQRRRTSGLVHGPKDSRAALGSGELCRKRGRGSPVSQPHDHSITSSARPRIDDGTVKPRALTVLRLIINLRFTTCWTGRSAGLAPLRTLAVRTAPWR